MGRMTWDLATLQYYCWAGRAGRKAYSDYAVDPDGPTRTTPQGWPGQSGGQLGLRRRPARPTTTDSDYGADTPRRTSWTCRVAREVLPRRSRYTRVNRSHEPVAGDCT